MPAGIVARSPTPSVTSLPSSNSIRTPPSSTSNTSRCWGVQVIASGASSTLVIPAQIGPSWTSSCIVEPGTSGSACHSSVVARETNMPGLISMGSSSGRSRDRSPRRVEPQSRDG
jgi:hypothetical protein